VLQSNGSGMIVRFDASASQDAASYQWSWGDGTVGTGGPVINHLYPVAQLGYTVRLIVLSSCGTSDTIFRSLRELGQIERHIEGAWSPNPSAPGQVLRWTGSSQDLGEWVTWFAMDGRRVALVPLRDGQSEVPVLPVGLYQVQWNLRGEVRRATLHLQP
jgi:hypothetical protein